MVELIPRTAEEKWESICRFLGILNNLENVTPETVISLYLYPTKLGNGAKYLQLKAIRDVIEAFFKEDAKDAFTDYMECYQILGEVRDLLNKDFTTEVERG